MTVAAGAVEASTINLDIRPSPPRDLPEALGINETSPLQKFEKELNARLARQPEDASAWHRLGTVLYRQRRETEARQAWQKAHELDILYAPPDVMADGQNVLRLVEQGEPVEARAALAKASEAHSDSPYFHLMRAEQAMRSRAFKAAENAYGKAIEVAPDFFAAKLNLGRYLEFTGRQDEARNAYVEATEDAPKHPMTWDFLGSHQFSAGEIEGALESFRIAETGDYEQPLAEIRLANLFVEAGDYIGARHWYQEGLKHAEAERDAILVSLGNVQLRLGLLEEATTTLDEVLKTSPSAPVLVARGFLAEEAGELEAAISLYRDAVKADPGNVIASNNLAMALVRSGINPEEALAHSRHAMQVEPRNASISATYAVALAHAENSDDALAALRRNLRISPDDPWIRFFLGRMLHDRSVTEEAQIHLEAVGILDPEFERIDEVQAVLSTYPR
ncbi:tetratricopeptide repeat protein [Roseovarius spongiae]|nr:tetratricopeptide repeat protein [Roseovarius spongiae]